MGSPFNPACCCPVSTRVSPGKAWAAIFGRFEREQVPRRADGRLYVSDGGNRHMVAIKLDCAAEGSCLVE